MALQLTGAAKKDLIANLQICLPVVVIGGGLTAIDTATESLAYYPLQVEKFLARHETLVAERGEAAVMAALNDEEREVAAEFIASLGHPRRAREGRCRKPPTRHCGAGERLGRRHHRLSPSPDRSALLHRIGEEVFKALEEDIRFAEGLRRWPRSMPMGLPRG